MRIFNHIQNIRLIFQCKYRPRIRADPVIFAIDYY